MTSNPLRCMPWQRRWLLLAASIILPVAGCRTTPSIDVPAAPSVHVLPYAADSLASTRRFTSELTASFPLGRQRRSVKVMVIIEQRPASLSIVGLSPAGIPLFTTILEADGSVETRQLTEAPGLAPERMLADLQLCLWPLAMLEAGLPPEFRVTQGNSNRSLLHDGRPLIDVRYDGRPGESFAANAALPVSFEHRLLGYRIDVRPLTDADVAGSGKD